MIARKNLSAECKILSTKDDPKVQRLRMFNAYYQRNKQRIKDFKDTFQRRFVTIPINTQALKSKSQPFKMPHFLEVKSTEFKLRKLNLDKELIKKATTMSKFRRLVNKVHRLRKECNQQEEDHSISKRRPGDGDLQVVSKPRIDVEEEEKRLSLMTHDIGGFISEKFASLRDNFEIKGVDERDLPSLARIKRKELNKGKSKKTVRRSNMSLSSGLANDISSLADLESYLGFKEPKDVPVIDEESENDEDDGDPGLI